MSHVRYDIHGNEICSSCSKCRKCKDVDYLTEIIKCEKPPHTHKKMCVDCKKWLTWVIRIS